MKIKGIIKDNEGFALILALVVMAAMTAIGIGALLLSTTDMLIARNDRDAKSAFYLAETGMEEALGRTDLPLSHARFVGETFAERQTRIAGTSTTFAADSFDSSSLNLGMGGTYGATLSYATESMADAWCDDDPVGNGCDNDEIVLYCKDFGFIGTEVPRTCTYAVPVYRIDSTSATSPSGTEASVRAYMAASTLNVQPPAGDMFSNTGIVAGGGSTSVSGSVCSENTTNCAGDCADACPGSYPGDAFMDDYLGVDLTDLKNYADSPSPYNQVQQTVTYDTSDWGDPCPAGDDDDLSDADINSDNNFTSDDIPGHICGNESKIIYIDNLNKTAKVTGGSGRGILIVKGDLNVTGNFWWEGMIYVMGELNGNGTVVVFGTMMANNTINFNGNVTALGSIEVAAGVAQTIGIPRMLRWSRQ